MQISLLTNSQLPWLVLILPVTLVLVSVVLLAERSGAGVNTILVNTTEDEEIQNGNCSLREAIRAANTDQPVDACPPGSGTDQILLPAGWYKVSAIHPLDVRSDLNLIGAGASNTIIEIYGPAGSRIGSLFNITDTDFNVTDLQISSGAGTLQSGK